MIYVFVLLLLCLLLAVKHSEAKSAKYFKSEQFRADRIAKYPEMFAEHPELLDD